MVKVRDNMIKVHFVDDGQDFLEWDINNGEVVDCSPFQGDAWISTKVHNTDIQEGDILQITTPHGYEVTLKHPVESVEE